ncbi:hypothetical protein [Phyllobacterium myrsinacearum]|uniref:Head-tail adaptor protein n=1 Tax=Phyllobacterium myrsinacearum TaxID=28101 RepID=A0A839EUE3_9HYPH|nr:hypothetical protein [Phyllobacterium myrsinacearum]MBA8881725.1 hypothetical protein [Phyllobacterium myrsinacearum]
MYRPNQTVKWSKRIGRDVYNRTSFAKAIDIGCAIVTLQRSSQQTTVRADSSGSRGAADEVVAKTKILVGATARISRGDLFLINDENYTVINLHPRFTVHGKHDHTEIDLEAAIA